MKINAECRICQKKPLVRVLDLGVTPLANGFLRQSDRDAEEPRYPLETYFCDECGLLQLVHIVPPETLFSDYLYVSSTSATLKLHFAGLAEDMVERQRLREGDLVIEVASNDGILQQEFKKRGIRAVGVEPAENLARLARADGLEVENDFFNLQTARRLREFYGPARAVTGSNVMGHVDALRDFVRGLEHVIADDGLVCMQVPHLLELVRGSEFDTIYHEHVSYFSLRAIQRAFADAGLTLYDVRRLPVHGGTIRVYARKASANPEPTPALLDLLYTETVEGLNDIETYEDFARTVERTKKKLVGVLSDLKLRGHRIAAYGAPAKGNTLLNYCEIGGAFLDYVVDRAPLKQGLLTPGSHLEVFPVEKLLDDMPDYLLILAWNFKDEIVEQQSEYFRRGGRFIVPLPQFHILEQSTVEHRD
ncbi:MAG: methyltransferase domain-containing protein [Dehalococcoidia bacterium]|nr:methyltransferase domain-containing protein [Dehalococcoidia bacterium]